ncbi:uncharacterized protein LOC123931199 [Meles meles]|uniref:uncharacterized protein LOC123931199 n=1 Tax=Meles meles TaxID=9662 RepID=UPI001E699EDD|nr:uncharacterized protein LOC123931199 [Meles meles]
MSDAMIRGSFGKAVASQDSGQRPPSAAPVRVMPPGSAGSSAPISDELWFASLSAAPSRRFCQHRVGLCDATNRTAWTLVPLLSCCYIQVGAGVSPEGRPAALCLLLPASPGHLSPCSTQPVCPQLTPSETQPGHWPPLPAWRRRLRSDTHQHPRPRPSSASPGHPRESARRSLNPRCKPNCSAEIGLFWFLTRPRRLLKGA